MSATSTGQCSRSLLQRCSVGDRTLGLQQEQDEQDSSRLAARAYSPCKKTRRAFAIKIH